MDAPWAARAARAAIEKERTIIGVALRGTGGSVNPGTTPFSATFASNCQAKSYGDAVAQNCMFNGQQGFCGNWWASYANTGQPLFPSEACVRDVRGGATMPWCRCMVGGGDC
jgi:hypothetical protein